MASRPRRSAAKKAQEQITDWADSERTSSMSTRARRSDGRTSGVSRGPPSSPGSEHLNLTVKVPANKLREATSRGRNSTGNSISVNSEVVAGRRNRELDSDLGSREGTPDLTKMTRRQRARFEDEPQQYMKLSDEVQAKKVFTAEELSMRRAEMARRRRNLSDKRNEEVKASIIIMETINKLLKKQAPKTKGKGANGEDTPGGGSSKPDVAFVRWVNSKKGSIVAVPEEIIGGPTGKVFGPPGLKSGKMVEEVA
ncbi:uncharacterized protein CLUP02_00723 [Colletotrichum lupini]|uniref:INO80 complex subunit B-like conserved region domain-containing protein n=1 Tax=Colletotrichum lupini TaxID=145971 RepID=A0A9Q8W8L6_9PEZI|nr:uncharacterized protein CLUP02_00723 [Colletotrichum lupini]UQC74076.1 hypothetical protein CLUP02_00723 [Colletotrichum lupini]